MEVAIPHWELQSSGKINPKEFSLYSLISRRATGSLAMATFSKRIKTAYNSVFINCFSISTISGEFPDYQLDFSRVLVARGRNLGATGVQVSSPAKDKLSFAWKNNAHYSPSQATTKLFLSLTVKRRMIAVLPCWEDIAPLAGVNSM